jgi:DNA-binding IclR family transcriptional regulator
VLRDRPKTAWGADRLSPSNRSLERGIDLLRAFRPGSALLGNGELAERTGLPRATVSRLTQTLVGSGLLQLDPAARAYRLSPAVLSLAHAMRSGSSLLAMAAPLMREVAERERVNVGLAAPDGDEMVYLESIRYSRRVALRTVVSGQRVPMELTSLGRAYLAAATDDRFRALMTHFRSRRRRAWTALDAEIRRSIADVRERGWCAVSWQPEVVAVATPIAVGGGVYVMNASVSTEESIDEVAPRLARIVVALGADVVDAVDQTQPGA